MRALSLIGMSGSGKSTWAKKLATAGFRTIACDDRIEEKLAAHLSAGHHRGVAGVAAWMGWPDQPTYSERAAKYLACEKQVMEELLSEIARSNQPVVVDTTGSVVFTGETICQRLRALTVVVYLEASAAEEQLLIGRFLHSPKPIVWADLFVPAAGESRRETAARCYPHLIALRKRLYEQYAHCRVPVAALRDTLEGQGFLRLIEAHAPSNR